MMGKKHLLLEHKKVLGGMLHPMKMRLDRWIICMAIRKWLFLYNVQLMETMNSKRLVKIL